GQRMTVGGLRCVAEKPLRIGGDDVSGRLLRLVCTAALAAGTVLVPLPAAARPEPSPATADAGPGSGAAEDEDPGGRSVAELLTDLQELYREAGKATETYNATEERLRKQRVET